MKCPACDATGIKEGIETHVFLMHFAEEGVRSSVVVPSLRSCWCGEWMFLAEMPSHLKAVGGLARHYGECLLGIYQREP